MEHHPLKRRKRARLAPGQVAALRKAKLNEALTLNRRRKTLQQGYLPLFGEDVSHILVVPPPADDEPVISREMKPDANA